MVLLLPLCLYLLCLAAGVVCCSENEPEVIKIIVKEGTDAILPCSLSTKEDIESKLFDWKRDGQKEVFLYDAGIHYNNRRSGQDDQFKGRVSHFPDELKNGNASIKIRNTKVADSGVYSCIFPRLQPETKFHIKLDVGAAAKPRILTVDLKDSWALLHCVVQGASPKPKVEWRDSSGNILPVKEPQISERGGIFNITLQTNVTKTDHYRCVATQDELSHFADADFYVPISGSNRKGQTSGFLVDGIVIGIVVCFFVVVFAVLGKKYINKIRGTPGTPGTLGTPGAPVSIEETL